MSKYEVKRLEVEEPSEDDLISSFFVTINPQQAYTNTDHAAEAREQLYDLGASIFNNLPEYLDAYVKGEDDQGNNVYIKQKLTPAQIDQFIDEAYIETKAQIGGKFHRLHTHTLIKLKHHDVRFRFNLMKVRAKLGKDVHLDVKFVKNHTKNIEQYIKRE